MREKELRHLADTRVYRPQAIAEAAARRRQAPARAGEHGQML